MPAIVSGPIGLTDLLICFCISCDIRVSRYPQQVNSVRLRDSVASLSSILQQKKFQRSKVDISAETVEFYPR